jgi:hypothetical protein
MTVLSNSMPHETQTTMMRRRRKTRTATPNQMRMSPRSSENPTNNSTPEARHLLRLR